MATSSLDRATLRRNVLELFDDLVSPRVARLLPLPLPRPAAARRGEAAAAAAPKGVRLPDMLLWLRGGRMIWVALEPTDRPISLMRKSFRADCADLETPFAILRQPADLLDLLRRQGVAMRDRIWGLPDASADPLVPGAGAGDGAARE